MIFQEVEGLLYADQVFLLDGLLREEFNRNFFSAPFFMDLNLAMGLNW